jgi:hypothetical protein
MRVVGSEYKGVWHLHYKPQSLSWLTFSKATRHHRSGGRRQRPSAGGSVRGCDQVHASQSISEPRIFYKVGGMRSEWYG